MFHLGPSLTPSYRKGELKLLLGLNPYIATGPTQISSRFLTELATYITPELKFIFQTFRNQSQKPEDWKYAFFTPLFKKVNRRTASYYRHVFLTSISCKVLEHIVSSHLIKFFEKHSILTDIQHGCRKKKSCEIPIDKNNSYNLASGLNNKQQLN